jgi:hemoglobin
MSTRRFVIKRIYISGSGYIPRLGDRGKPITWACSGLWRGGRRVWKRTCVSRASLYEFAGGHAAFLRLAAAHHERCLQDPVLNHPFSHPGHPHHVERLANYWAEVLGGPPLYSGSSDGQPGMLLIHSGMGADDDLGDRFVACFVQALDDAALPDDPDFRTTLHAYMEWAVRDVHVYNPRGSVVPSDLPVPRWTWDGLEIQSS